MFLESIQTEMRMDLNFDQAVQNLKFKFWSWKSFRKFEPFGNDEPFIMNVCFEEYNWITNLRALLNCPVTYLLYGGCRIVLCKQ